MPPAERQRTTITDLCPRPEPVRLNHPRRILLRNGVPRQLKLRIADCGGSILTPLPNRGNGQDRAGVSPAAFKRPPPTLRRWSADFAPEQTRSPYRPRRLYVGGAVVFFSFANPRQRQCERGRGWAPRNSWQETRGFNHRSTDIKSEGAIWSRSQNAPDCGSGSGWSIPNPQSPIRNPQSAIRNPQSAIPNPQSPTRNPQSPIRNPQSPIPNPQSYRCVFFSR